MFDTRLPLGKNGIASPPITLINAHVSLYFLFFHISHFEIINIQLFAQLREKNHPTIAQAHARVQQPYE